MQEIAVTRTGARGRSLRLALGLALNLALATLGGSIMLADVALGSQGPGGGMGAASHLTQMLMAIVVYGTAGAIAAIAMIRAARRRTRS
ncbi:hypothetical protein QU41_09060 [Bradyrhizobium elkanii]|nr:hypothetical protein QU41_09060 [Bradyrhizobium elkanii]